jgi:hypothetical protein
MSVSIIAPGTKLETSSMGLACYTMREIIEHIYYEDLNDVMTVHNSNDEIIAEVTVRDKSVRICRSGVIANYCLPDAEDIISNIIFDCAL